MTCRVARNQFGDATDMVPIVFEAVLAGSGRKCFTLDSDGEATLTLAIPAVAVAPLALAMAEGRLSERSFTVRIEGA